MIRENTVNDDNSPDRLDRVGTDSQRKALAVFQGLARTPQSRGAVQALGSPVKTELGGQDVSKARRDESGGLYRLKDDAKPRDPFTPKPIKSDISGPEHESLLTSKAVRRQLGASFSDEHKVLGALYNSHGTEERKHSKKPTLGRSITASGGVDTTKPPQRSNSGGLGDMKADTMKTPKNWPKKRGMQDQN